MVTIFIGIFGGIGAATRFICDGLLRSLLGRRFPWATMIVNVTGSFVLGIVIRYTNGHVVAGSILLFIATGFCGGFTTFSTAIFESVRLLQEKRYFSFGVQLLGNLFLCVLAVIIGFQIAS